MNKIRKLKAEEIECRIAQCFDGKCTALLYKTARVDRAILTETYGDLWQNDFKVIDGKMYGGIGIYNTDIKEWLWRWDCGTESNTEKEKGEASDCFKRAGFKWGIGIELYSSPQIWLIIPTKKNDKGKFEPVNKYDKYDVREVGYDDNGNINKLVIVDSGGDVLFSFPSKTKKTMQKKETEPDPDTDIFAGISAIEDITNLEIYYKSLKDSVANKNKFIELLKKRKKELNYGNNNG